MFSGSPDLEEAVRRCPLQMESIAIEKPRLHICSQLVGFQLDSPSPVRVQKREEISNDPDSVPRPKGSLARFPF